MITCPPGPVEEPWRPYSSDVVYSDGDMVVSWPRVLVGNTRTQGGEQAAVGLSQISGPTYTTLILSEPSKGSQTLTSVVKPLSLVSLLIFPSCWVAEEFDLPLVRFIPKDIRVAR